MAKTAKDESKGAPSLKVAIMIPDLDATQADVDASAGKVRLVRAERLVGLPSERGIADADRAFAKKVSLASKGPKAE